MDTTESSAPHAHPSIEDHDDTVEAHYSCLERPCACIDGWVFLGRVVESEHDLEARSSSTSACSAAAARIADSPDCLCSYHRSRGLRTDPLRYSSCWRFSCL